MSRSSSNDPANRARWRAAWDKQAPAYDRQMRFFDRKLFKDSRDWICSQATGDVLEVAIGTGLNLEHYPADVRLTGIELSPGMLKLARDRAVELSREVDLREGDAHQLDFADASFDTVVCTFSLCAIPDHRQAVAEMHRVLRPGGLLLLADHVASPYVIGRAIQRLAEVVTVRMGGEHFRRRPLEVVQAEGLTIEQRERFGMGLVERLAARKSS
jgi:ubiquinone/menaquinone biosynthesis C-methylase UbiE